MRKLFMVIAVLVMAAQLFMISSVISGPSRADAEGTRNELIAPAWPRWKRLMSA